MERDKIVLTLIFVALAIVILYKFMPTPLESLNDATDDTGASPLPLPGPRGGFNYFTYNQPYAFAPPVQNIMPSTTQSAQVATAVSSGDSCGACGGN